MSIVLFALPLTSLALSLSIAWAEHRTAFDDPDTCSSLLQGLEVRTGDHIYVHPLAISENGHVLKSAHVRRRYWRSNGIIESVWVDLQLEDGRTLKLESSALDALYVNVLRLSETVAVGADRKPIEVIDLRTKKTTTFREDNLPIGARFVKFIAPNQALVRIDNQRALVPFNRIRRIKIDDREDFERKLTPYLSTQRTYKVGERVRFRDHQGFMRTATYLDKQRDTVVLRSTGETLNIPSAEVFHIVSANPVTIPFATMKQAFDHASWTPPDVTNEESVRRILNAAAAMTSEPAFINSTWYDRWRSIVQFTHVFIPYDHTVRSPTQLGITRFSDYLHLGMGVCREMTLLSLMIAAEAGISSELWFGSSAYGPPSAHVWLQVKAPFSDEAWIVEPSGEAGRSFFRADVDRELSSYYQSETRKMLLQIDL